MKTEHIHKCCNTRAFLEKKQNKPKPQKKNPKTKKIQLEWLQSLFFISQAQ